jgi:hypothetical protein
VNDESGDGTTAKIAGGLGTFSIEVLSYQFPARTSGSDANWLTVRFGWQGRNMRVRVEGPYLETTDLTSMAAALRAVAGRADAGPARIALTEPILELGARRVGSRGHCELELVLHGEPATSGEHLSVRFEVPAPDLAAFADGLDTLARRFPVR